MQGNRRENSRIDEKTEVEEDMGERTKNTVLVKGIQPFTFFALNGILYYWEQKAF